MDSRDISVERAKLAEQAERYDDMAKVWIDLYILLFNLFRHARCMFRPLYKVTC